MGITLTTSLQPGEEARAETVLRYYFLSGTFTGGRWDIFDPSGTRAASANTFTADDLVACALLATPIEEDGVVALLQDQRATFDELLAAIGPDRDFISMDSTDGVDYAPVRALYKALVGVHDIGQTKATKLLARKRPRLVPIVDRRIQYVVFNGAKYQWEVLHQALRADDCALWNRLVELHKAAGLSEHVSILRVFDVLAWMDGSRNSEYALQTHMPPAIT